MSHLTAQLQHTLAQPHTSSRRALKRPRSLFTRSLFTRSLFTRSLFTRSLCALSLTLSACGEPEEGASGEAGAELVLAGEPAEAGAHPEGTPPPRVSITRPSPSGGQEASFEPIDLSSWSLTPPQMGGSDDGGVEAGTAAGQADLSASPCELPQPAQPIDHPFARGEEAPRPEGARERARSNVTLTHNEVRPIAHPQLTTKPPYTLELAPLNAHASASAQKRSVEEAAQVGRSIVMPTLEDDQPLFERAQDTRAARCYEVRPGEGRLLNAEQAFEHYKRLVSATLWRTIDERPEHRTVIGLRGANPGRLSWHHNTPNQFNDTIALLWRDSEGLAHILELPVTTEMGVYDFGADSSSALRPNRHYPYINGWHRDYNALQINLPSYPVRDDTNNNGHWDSDRNGWLLGPEEGLDYDRLGTAHNIHGAAKSGSLERAEVNIASAGCQVIPGALNWERFITMAWTNTGDEVDYFLIDARDVPQRFFEPCAQEDGSHACPYSVTSFPYSASDSTALSQERLYDRYSCDEANEGGAERVYVFNLPVEGRLRASVTALNGADPDLHLLEGDDARACRVRGHTELEDTLPPGRYVLIVDTWVNSSGQELAGEYELLVEWSPR